MPAHEQIRPSNNPQGRPRSGELTARIHNAVFELLAEGGYGALTMEALAARAGSTRPALYRRYASPAEAVLGALQAAGETTLRMQNSGDLDRDLQKYFTELVRVLGPNRPTGIGLRAVLSVALVDPVFQTVFAELIRTRRRPVAVRVSEAYPALTGQQLDEILDLMFGPILYRLLVRGKRVSRNQVRRYIQVAVGVAADCRPGTP